MFSGTEQMKIWNISRDFAGRVEDGETDNPHIPTIDYLMDRAVKTLQEAGFSVEDADPSKANCIIRVWRHTGMFLPKHSYATWMYGYETYVENLGCFRSEPAGKKFNPATQEVSVITGPKRTKVVLYNTCFTDHFVKLTVQ